MCFSARDLFNSSLDGGKVAVSGNNVSVSMASDQSISLISTIGSLTKQYNLRDLVRDNASLLPLYYSDVRQTITKTILNLTRVLQKVSLYLKVTI